MKKRFIQVDCIEGKSIDKRQANAVLKYTPDVILLEYPADKIIDYPFNKYPASKKPLKLVYQIQSNLKKNAKKTPWILSDIQVWENIIFQWNRGFNVRVYKIDGPSSLVGLKLFPKNFNGIPHHLKWWVRTYLREKLMKKNIEKVFKKNSEAKTFLVFLQNFHWQNVRFLLKNPTKEKIWKRYFGKFKIAPDGIEDEIYNNKVLLKFWRRYSGF